MEEQNIKTKKNKKWMLPVLVSVIAVIAVTVCVVIYNLPSNRRDRQLELAKKYMSELDYENAILVYKAVIEIEPKCVDAYIGLADAYLAGEDYSAAISILEEGIKKAGSSTVLEEKLEQAKKEYQNAQRGFAGYVYNADNAAISGAEVYLTGMTDVRTETDENGYYNINHLQPGEYILKFSAGGYLNYETTVEISEGQYELEVCLELDDGVGDMGENVETENGSSIEGAIIIWKKMVLYNDAGSIISYWEYEYDKNGNSTKYAEYDSEGVLNYLLEYDEYGNIIYSQGGRPWEEYVYDENGRIVKFIVHKTRVDETIQYWDEYEYGENGNKSKVVRYLEDGSVTSWREYEYDEKGNMTRCVLYNAYGSIDYVDEYEYDENGYVTKCVNCNADGNVNSWYEREYDENGNETKWLINQWDGSIDLYEYQYQYDANGNIMKYVKYVNGSISSWYESEYDENGSEMKRINYQADGSISSWYECEYDINGNIIKSVVYDKDGNITRCVEYEYKYQ